MWRDSLIVIRHDSDSRLVLVFVRHLNLMWSGSDSDSRLVLVFVRHLNLMWSGSETSMSVEPRGGTSTTWSAC